jgi:hypothetical protein
LAWEGRRVMRKIAVILTFAVASVVPALPASATVHPLTCAEKSPADTVADTQNPPGITDPETDGGPDQSRATEAQPFVAVTTNPGTDAALKPEGC